MESQNRELRMRACVWMSPCLLNTPRVLMISFISARENSNTVGVQIKKGLFCNRQGSRVEAVGTETPTAVHRRRARRRIARSMARAVPRRRANQSTEGEQQMFEVEPPPPIGWKQALKAGWTPRLAGVPDRSMLAFYGREVVLGISVCTAQIPETIAFSFLARVRPPVALHAAWMVGLTCAVLGGRPGMVEGATGAFAAIINVFLDVPEVPGGNGAGIELVFPSVMLAGLIMLLVVAFRLDRFITLLPLPVLVGFWCDHAHPPLPSRPRHLTWTPSHRIPLQQWSGDRDWARTAPSVPGRDVRELPARLDRQRHRRLRFAVR